MGVMRLLLFFRNKDFGLFKLAMFAQPLLIAVGSFELGQVGWSSALGFSKNAMPIVFILQVISQYDYVGKNTGEEFGGINEIQHASLMKVNEQFKNLIDTIDNSPNLQTKLLIDASTLMLAKFQALYTNCKSKYFQACDFFGEEIAIFPNLKELQVV